MCIQYVVFRDLHLYSITFYSIYVTVYCGSSLNFFHLYLMTFFIDIQWTENTLDIFMIYNLISFDIWIHPWNNHLIVTEQEWLSGGWPKNHGEQWTAESLLGVELKLRSRDIPQSLSSRTWHLNSVGFYNYYRLVLYTSSFFPL